MIKVKRVKVKRMLTKINKNDKSKYYIKRAKKRYAIININIVYVNALNIFEDN